MYFKFLIFILTIIFYGSQESYASKAESDSKRLAEVEKILSYPEMAGTAAWVGVGSGCTHSSLQAALDDSNYDIIYIADSDDQMNGNFIIQRSLTLIGGYSACNSSSSTSKKLEINGGGSAVSLPVFRIYSASSNSAQNVTLINLSLAGGFSSVNSGTRGGGLRVYGAHQQVTLWNVLMYLNTATDLGGGASIENADVIFQDSPVMYNNAVFSGGGGVYCEDSEVTFAGSSVIALNHTSHEDSVGGGIFSNSCDITYQATEGFEFGFFTNPPTYYGISNNKAKLNGAGVYAVGRIEQDSNDPFAFDYHDTDIKIRPPNTSSGNIIIKNNEIDGTPNAVSASAIYIGNNQFNYGCSDPDAYYGNVCTNKKSTLELENVNIRSNSGGHNVITVSKFAEMNMHCDSFSNKLCNEIKNNSTVGGPSSRTLILFDQYNLHPNSESQGYSGFNNLISGVDIKGNFMNRLIKGVSDDGYTDISDIPIAVTVRQALITHNTLFYNLISMYHNVNAYVMQTTIAENNFNSATVFNNSSTGTPAHNGSKFEIEASIVDMTGAQAMTEGSSSIYFDCVLRTAGINNSPVDINRVSTVSKSDLGFVDPSSSTAPDFHLKDNSPAVDYCTQLDHMNLTGDMDGDPMPWNHPQVSAEYGNFDLGVDELYFVESNASADINIFSYITPVKASYVVGEPITITHLIHNNGPDSATDATLHFYPGSNFQLGSWNTDGLCSGHGCANSMPSGDGETITIIGQFTAPGDFNLYSQFYASESDPTVSNNHSTILVKVEDLIFKDGFE